ncbi:hypothetical protein [Agrobacterium fabrum]|jgi:hypothetical protein|uniref:hypothetical protein n=1 Tax=Agrobacterium fabrum TaxID=1176649 RepID=UPI000A8B6B6C|nr:hypothetical protein [Agrobacterium fabrum]MDH6294076.1 hypothetical protein [Agrobacterium fabrum]WLP54224.1 hypothetical protein Q8X45_01500 [Agrobacterium fabrum]
MDLIMNIRSLRFLPVLMLGCLLSNAAAAETTEWMSGKDAFPRADKLRTFGMIVTRMDCKDSGQRSLDVDSALVRMHYTRNTKMLDWRIDGWNHLQENKDYWAERGYTLASHTVFVRKTSGLRLYCTVYNK